MLKEERTMPDSVNCNRPFASSLESLLHSEAKCEIFVTSISSIFNLNGN